MKMISEVIQNYINTLQSSIEKSLTIQLRKLGVDVNNLDLIKKHCRKINYPIGTKSDVIGDKAIKISDYFFEDILLMRLQRDEDDRHSILIVKEYDDATKDKIKNYII